MLSLEDIGVKYGTGKSSLCCNYLKFYDLLFGKWRSNPIKILEVGIQFGNSLRTWREYFPEAHVIGIDAVDTGVKFAVEDRIVIIYGNAYSPEIIKMVHGTFDIVIDDGSHTPTDQVFFVTNYAPMITQDGVLVVEDILEPSTVGLLKGALPKGFDYAAMDSTEGNIKAGCRLFFAWRTI